MKFILEILLERKVTWKVTEIAMEVIIKMEERKVQFAHISHSRPEKIQTWRCTIIYVCINVVLCEKFSQDSHVRVALIFGIRNRRE